MDEETKQEAASMNAGNEGRLQLPPQNLNKKRKVALFVAYLGAGYSGMQNNPGVKTIESTLEASIARAGGISKDNAGDFFKTSWMRAARTDKGVSAVGQVVSLKMIVGNPDIVDRINAELPPEIRVLGYKRVIGSFDARHSCDRRRYEYVIPAFAFDPSSCVTRAQRNGYTEAETAGREISTPPTILEAQPDGASKDEGRAEADVRRDQGAAQSAAVVADTKTKEEEMKTRATEEVEADIKEEEGAPCPALGLTMDMEEQQGNEGPTAKADESSPAGGCSNGAEAQAAEEPPGEGGGFEFGNAELARLNALLSQYQGTHNFSNFATKVNASDSNAKRHILSVTCPGAFTLQNVLGAIRTLVAQGQTWVRIVILGQSFMLNQIRKMIGLVVAVMRGAAPDNALKLALDVRRSVDTPMAPAVGLFLDESIFQSYNDHWGAERDNVLSLDDFQEQVAEFKRRQLYPSIAAQDAAEQCTAQFVRGLSESSFCRWEALPLKDLPKPRRSKEPGSAAIVAGLESYGVPGGKPQRGEKRKYAESKWRSRSRQAQKNVSCEAGIAAVKEEKPMAMEVLDTLRHEWSD